MFNPFVAVDSPYGPRIHLPDDPFAPQISPNMNMDAGMQRRAAHTEGRARRSRYVHEDADELGVDSDFDIDDDWDHVDHQDIDHDRGARGRRDHDYREADWHARPDLREPVFFRREQDDLEIAHLQRSVGEANRALEDAKRNLREAKMRIKDRRREEKQQLKERSRVDRSVPEFVRPYVDDVYERMTDSQTMREYLSPTGHRSRPQTPQPSSSSLARSRSRPPSPEPLSSSLPARSRSPSPYRFSSRPGSEIPVRRSQSSQSMRKNQPRSRTPKSPVHKGEGDAASAAQEQVYESFKKLHDLAKEFQTLKQNFVYPSVIEFQKPGSQSEVISVRARCSPPADDQCVSDGTDHHVGSEAGRSEGKLTYTRANEGLNTYTYTMEKLLGMLDSVESWNETSVRTRRRAIVGDIEQESLKLERYREKVWREYQDNAKVYG